ncbi:MAG: FKBP-type peptidyl-prolyl cis-trans isomerase [Pseudomonadota bacterium]
MPLMRSSLTAISLAALLAACGGPAPSPDEAEAPEPGSPDAAIAEVTDEAAAQIEELEAAAAQAADAVIELDPLAALLAEARACEGGGEGPIDFTPDAAPADVPPAIHNTAVATAYLAATVSQPCVYTLPSGLQIRVDRASEGASPNSGDLVTVHYEGWLPDGSVFDSSYQRGEPATFPSNRLIRGWVEALPLMRVGEHWTLFIPADLGYGARGTPGGPIGPNSALSFTIELVALPGAEAEPQ